MVSTAASAASASGTNTFLRDISDEQMIELLDRYLVFYVGISLWVDTKKQQHNGYNAEIVISITYNTGTK